jgi:hypothetical protein
LEYELLEGRNLTPVASILMALLQVKECRVEYRKRLASSKALSRIKKFLKKKN